MKKCNTMCLLLLSIFVSASILMSSEAIGKTQPNAQRNNIYIFNSPQKEASFNKLIGELRCMVCQNETLADSGATFAIDLRQQIYLKVKAGESNKQIISYFINRYGDFILFKPPLQKNTWILWVAPFGMLLLGLMLLFLIVKFRRPSTKKDLSNDEKKRLKNLLS